MKLSNQVAIVTGAGRNIGEEISKTLAAEGAKVAVVDLDKGRGDRVAAEIAKAGGEAAAFVADVAAEVSQHAARQMVAQGSGGKIVNVGSTSGFFGRSRAVAYSAAKGGVANLTRAMAVQLAPYRIRVNGVVPNKIGSPVGKDEFDPTRPVVNLIGRPGVPLDMARAVLFLVSGDSEFIAGNMLFVDGGVSAMMVGEKSV